VSQIQAQKRVTYPEFNFLCKGSERNLLPFIRNENHFIDFGGASAPLFLCSKTARPLQKAAVCVCKPKELQSKNSGQHEKSKSFPAIDPRVQLW